MQPLKLDIKVRVPRLSGPQVRPPGHAIGYRQSFAIAEKVLAVIGARKGRGPASHRAMVRPDCLCPCFSTLAFSLAHPLLVEVLLMGIT